MRVLSLTAQSWYSSASLHAYSRCRHRVILPHTAQSRCRSNYLHTHNRSSQVSSLDGEDHTVAQRLELSSPVRTTQSPKYASKSDILAGSLRAADPTKPLMNFSPGPTSLPRSVMETMQAEFLSVDGCGMSAMELSHRSPEFLNILRRTKDSMRRVFDVPDNFKIIFCQGGGHGQFAALPLNLCGEGEFREAHYITSGFWSQRAASEASKFADVHIIGRRGATSKGDGIVAEEESLSSKQDVKGRQAAYVYCCSNETADGFELQNLDEVAKLALEHSGGAPLMVDASSDIGSKRIQWEHVGALFACAPKNLGAPGLTVVFAREDLIYGRSAQSVCPGILDWEVLDSSECLWNTPPTFNIYVTGKVLEWIEQQGGLEEMERRSAAKAEMLWNVIKESDVYSTPSMAENHRSRCNVPFDICGGDPAATEEFLVKAYEANMVGLRTKTPFGFGDYLRASLYNSVPVEHVTNLAQFMTRFAAEYRHRKNWSVNFDTQELQKQNVLIIEKQDTKEQVRYQMAHHQPAALAFRRQKQKRRLAMQFHTTSKDIEP